jgi:hypothetical protein
MPSQASQQDTISDSGYEQSQSPSNTLKRRAIANNAMINHRSSTERLSSFPLSVYSSSSYGLNDFPLTSAAGLDRENTFESLDLSSSSKQTKPLFEAVPDYVMDSNELVADQQQKVNGSTPSVDTANDDRRSTSSEKVRRQLLTSRIFKPFQNMRFRKKSNTS